MQRRRNKISEADRRYIIGRSGGRCNKCRRELFIENEFGERIRLGDDAHIVSCSEFGPRGNSAKTNKERNSAINLILLCKICHSKIDQQTEKYSEEKIINIRDKHYSWVDTCLGNAIVQRPRFHYLSYINIPRVDMYAVVNSIALPTFAFGNATSIRGLGFQAGRLMASYVSVLNHEDLYANEFNDLTGIKNVQVGSYWFSAQSNFRSKKIRDNQNTLSSWDRLESVIYRKFDGWRLFCLIDPRWITTSTAFTTLSGGTLQTMGLFHINKIDEEKHLVITSPLFLGPADNSLFS